MRGVRIIVTDLTVVSEPQLALLDVIFVHGLRGDARASWSSESGYWPEWVAEANRSARVIALNYRYNFSFFQRQSMTLRDHATALLELTRVHGVGARPLVFIAHGLGGIVVKEMLRQATMTAPTYRPIWERTVAVVFLATPIALPRLIELPFLKQAVGLGSSSQLFEEAHNFYRQEAPRKGIATLSFAPARSISVTRDSADPGVPDLVVIPLDTSDVEVARPRSRSSLVVASVQNLLSTVQRLILEDRLPAGSADDD